MYKKNRVTWGLVAIAALLMYVLVAALWSSRPGFSLKAGKLSMRHAIEDFYIQAKRLPLQKAEVYGTRNLHHYIRIIMREPEVEYARFGDDLAGIWFSGGLSRYRIKMPMVSADARSTVALLRERYTGLDLYRATMDGLELSNDHYLAASHH